jgi:hypothetical protein
MTIDELKELIQNDEHRQLELKKTTGELKDSQCKISKRFQSHEQQ